MEELVKVNEEVANKVLTEIDSLILKLSQSVKETESGFMSLAFLMVEAKRGAYWTLRGYKSEHDYIQAVFPQSRSQYYRLIRIGTNLQRYDHKQLEKMGSSKAEDLVRIHIHHDGEVPKEWMKKAETLDKDTFRRAVRNYLDEKDEDKKKQDPRVEDHFITFRIFGDGIDIVNQAFETIAKDAGSDKSLGALLILMCGNYLAGVTGIGRNSFLLSMIANFIQQLDFAEANTSERLIGTVAAAVDKNTGTEG